MSEFEPPRDPETVRADARREAQRVLENAGPGKLREHVERLEEQEAQLDEEVRRFRWTFKVQNLLRGHLDEEGRLGWYLRKKCGVAPEEEVIELFSSHGSYVVGRFKVWAQAYVRNGYPSSELSLIDAAHFGLSSDYLVKIGFPDDRSEYAEVGIPIDAETTWADAARVVGETWQEYRQKWCDVAERWNRVCDRLDAFESVLDERGDMREYQEWTAGEKVTERAVDLLAAYNRKAQTVQEMHDLHVGGGLLDELGYLKPRSKFTSLQEALRASGWTYEDENPDSFVGALAGALEEVDELPDDLSHLARSCKILVDEPGAHG